MTMIIATHEMSFAREVASKICFLDAGVILEEGPPAQIFGDPQRAAHARVPEQRARGGADVSVFLKRLAARKRTPLTVALHPRDAALLPLPDARLARARPAAHRRLDARRPARSSTSTRTAREHRGEDLGVRADPLRDPDRDRRRGGLHPLRHLHRLRGDARDLRRAAAPALDRGSAPHRALPVRRRHDPGQVVDQPARPRRVGAQRARDDREPARVDDRAGDPVRARLRARRRAEAPARQSRAAGADPAGPDDALGDRRASERAPARPRHRRRSSATEPL